MNRIFKIAFALTTILSSSAFASTSSYDSSNDPDYYQSNIFTTVKVGTLGPGIDIGYQFNPYFDIRANVNGFKFSKDHTVNDVYYHGDARLLTAGLLADYYPFANGFRLTAGAYYNGNKVTAKGYYNDTYYGINVNDYGHAEASVDYKKFAPYLGFGYQGGSDNGWIFTADLGVMYQGSARVHYNTVCNSQVVCSVLQNQIEEKENEQRDKIQNDVDKLKWYPVASIGVGYRF